MFPVSAETSLHLGNHESYGPCREKTGLRGVQIKQVLNQPALLQRLARKLKLCL